MAKKSSNLDNARLATFVVELKDSLDKSAAKLGPVAPALTSDSKRRTLKFRKGAAGMIPKLATILRASGLDANAMSVDKMLSDLERAQLLDGLHGHLVQLTKRVSDEAFLARTSSLRTALYAYAAVTRMAKDDGNLALELAPIKSFFGFRSASVEAEREPKREKAARAKRDKAKARLGRQEARAAATLARIQAMQGEMDASNDAEVPSAGAEEEPKME